MYKAKILTCLLVALLLQGCFEVIEEVSYKDTESGTYLVTVNCSKSKTRLNALIKLDTFMGLNIPKQFEVSDYFSKARQAVSKIQGISAVNSTTDYDNFIFTFTFAFDKTETLNKAINAAALSITEKNNIPYYNVFSYKQQVFERHNTPDDSTAHSIRERKDQLKLISDARATSIYRFQQPVMKVNNAKAVISKNKKAVMLQMNITDLLINPSLFSNTITF